MITYSVDRNRPVGELGWITIVLAIVGVVASLIEKGYPYYDALKTAKAMQKDQKILTEKENIELAQALTQKYPVLTYDDWIELVKATNLIYPPIVNADNSDGSGDKPKAEINYWTYLAIFAAILVVTKR